MLRCFAGGRTTGSRVQLTSVAAMGWRFVLSQAEMAALVESYHSYLADCEEGNVPQAHDFDPFTDVSDGNA